MLAHVPVQSVSKREESSLPARDFHFDTRHIRANANCGFYFDASVLDNDSAIPCSIQLLSSWVKNITNIEFHDFDQFSMWR